jgi:hypothetical protein
MPNSKEIPDKGLLSSANSGMTELVLFFAVIPRLMRHLLSYFAVIPRLMRDLPIEVEPTFYAMPNSKEIPDKGLLRSANFRNDGIGVIFSRHPALDAGSHIGWWEIPNCICHA